MIVLPVLAGHQGAARRRAVLDTLAMGLPLVLVMGAFAWRLFDTAAVSGTVFLALAALALAAIRRARRFDRDWLIGALDARVGSFEDSSALLFADDRATGSLAALQRGRLEARIADAEAVDLRPCWSRRSIAWAWGAAAFLMAAILGWPEDGRIVVPARPSPGNSVPAGPPRIAGARLRIVPPAYTGLPAREQSALDARAPEGSRVEWAVGFDPRPPSAALTFPDDGTVPLARKGTRWVGARIMDRSILYRIDAAGLARQRLHRLEAIADAPPNVRGVEPASSPVMATPGQARWTPVFEASDDYGIAAAASLRIIVTQGDGENVTFTQRSMALRGRGGARSKRYSATLDLGREGLTSGGDMIVQLVVADNRAPQAQEVEGPSVILRRPAALGSADGLDGMMQKVMPAYFRSQRQIIIDAEALIATRRRTPPDAFLDRSNGLGNDQAQLRLRYGQFMGEEASGGIALPTNDAPAAAPPAGDEAIPAADVEPGVRTDDHDHADDAAPAAGFGSQVDALGEFGHAHDSGDAATLFDGGTRSTLSLALDAMWGSERALRQGEPDAALPFAYRALEYLKEAQQASRMFLARTGSDLPPIDPSRRMGGDRSGIVAGPLPVSVARPADVVPVEAWRALEERPGRTPPLRLDALGRWVRGNRARLADPLALTAAIDTFRNEPTCLDCRRRLRALLWTAIERPSASVRRRDTPGSRGRRYLNALR